MPFLTDNRETLPTERLEGGLQVVAEHARELNLSAVDERRLAKKVREGVLHERRDAFAEEKSMTAREWCEHFIDHDEPIEHWTDLECQQHRRGSPKRSASGT